MRKLLIGILIIIAFSYYSCEKDESYSSTKMTDAELIAAIQKSTNKVSINESELPTESRTIISNDYSESFTESAMLAPDLGYQVDLRRGEGSEMGEKSDIYFNLDGRKLVAEESERGNSERGKDKNECFDIVFPITVVMPDGSEIVGEDGETLRELIKDWYENNPDIEDKPAFVFPIDLAFSDTTITVNTEEELDVAREKCKEESGKRECFEFVLPVTFIMEDGTEITVEVEEDFDLIKEWFEANPDANERPSLVYPVDIEYEDGTVKTITNEEEMEEAEKDCHEEKERCFEFVLPVSFTMADGTVITVEVEEDYELLKEWHEANPGNHQRPAVNFPVDIIFEGGETRTINNEEEMQEAHEDCKEERE